MANLEVCLVCLEQEVKMYDIDDCKIRADFNLVSGLNTFKGCGLPSYICYQCFALVTKYMKFRKKCQKTYHHLTLTRRRFKELTLANIRKVNRERLGLKSTLSIIKLDITKSYLMSDETIAELEYCDVKTGIEEEIVFKEENKAGLNNEIKYDLDSVQDNDKENNEEYLDLNEFDNDFQYDEEYLEDDKIDKQTEEDNNKKLNNDNEHTKFVNHIKKVSYNDYEQDDSDNESVEADILNVDNDSHDDDEEVNENRSDIRNELMKSTITNAMVIDEDYATAFELSKAQQEFAFNILRDSGTGKLKCSVCKQGHKNKKALKIHMKRHEKHVSGIYGCDICQFYFMSEYLLKSHVERKHLYKYVCKKCARVTYTRSQAKLHYRLVHREKTDIVPRPRENIKPKSNKKKSTIKVYGRTNLPEDIKVTSISPLQQYKLVEDRKLSKNYIESEYKCELCYKGFRSYDTFRNHQNKHDPAISGALECDVCKLRFRNITQMYKHMLITHVHKYSCRKCDFESYSCPAALNHYKWHNNVTYPCPHCDAVFSKISTQFTHIRIKHPSTAICTLCGRSFVSATGLYFHNQKKHTEEEIEKHKLKIKNNPKSRLYCKECQLQFASQEAFDVHLGSSNKHVNYNFAAKPYFYNGRSGNGVGTVTRKCITTVCEECGLTIPNDSQARRHYKTEHPGVPYIKRFMCDICGHTTRQYANLTIHMRVHTNEKPFECQQCGRTFATVNNRDRHLLVHTGERKFQCEVCLKRFTQKGVLKLHVQTVHLKIPHPPWNKKNRKRREELASTVPEPVSEPGLEIDTQVEYLEEF